MHMHGEMPRRGQGHGGDVHASIYIHIYMYIYTYIYIPCCRVVEKGMEEMELDGQTTASLPAMHPFFARDEGVDGQ